MLLKRFLLLLLWHNDNELDYESVSLDILKSFNFKDYLEIKCVILEWLAYLRIY